MEAKEKKKKRVAKNISYSEEELKSIPESAILGSGCGNPAALADLKEGETVLDLGSGSGIEVFLAAKRVGETGYVIGVDMTGDMIKKATETASSYGYQNVEFRFGEGENLPVEDNSIDVIISNSVINFSSDKLKTYQEALRVLKPGGRILISDLVTPEGELPKEIKRSFGAWAGCIAGAIIAGLKNITIVAEEAFLEPQMDNRLVEKVISILVKAYK